MQALATAAGGEGAAFLSPTYEGSSVPHLWKCGGGREGGHVFEKTPNYVRKGLVVGRAFCRECERERKKREGEEEGEGGREEEGRKKGGRRV